MGVPTPTGSLLSPHGPVRVPVPDFRGQDGTPAQGRGTAWESVGRAEAGLRGSG